VLEHILSIDVDECSLPKTFLDNGRTTTVVREPVRIGPVERSSNGIEAKEDEGSDEYEDSEEEFSQTPSKKIKLEKVVAKKMKKKKEKDPVPEVRVVKPKPAPLSLEDLEVVEEYTLTDNFGDTFRPKKIPFFGVYDGYHWLRTKGFDSYEFELVSLTNHSFCTWYKFNSAQNIDRHENMFCC